MAGAHREPEALPDGEPVPIAGTKKELVMINLHLEAYDNGEGKVKQTRPC